MYLIIFISLYFLRFDSTFNRDPVLKKVCDKERTCITVCAFFSDSGSESIASADSEASDQDEPETDRKKSLKKRSSFQKSQSQNRRVTQELDLEG